MKRMLSIIACILVQTCSYAQSTDNGDFKTDTIEISKTGSRFFEAVFDSSGQVMLKEVKRNSDKSKTISLKFSYNSGIGAMLEISNPFLKQLVYKAELYSYSKNDYIVTSTVPVFPQISSFETWPYKIDKMRLTGFKLTTE